MPFEDLAEPMVDWAEGRLVRQAEAAEPAAELSTGCREEDTRRLNFLEQSGFFAQPVRTLHFIRRLDELLPAPVLPAGFQIRPIRGEEELEAWVTLHQAAHGTQSMTVDQRRAMMRTPEYERELDLVAVAPDGRLAAYVMGHFSPEENLYSGQKMGYTDPVATHPDFQRLGLARALLLAGFERLKERGLDSAQLGTWGENTAMIRTAESVGCRVLFNDHFLQPADSETRLLTASTWAMMPRAFRFARALLCVSCGLRASW